MIRKPAIDQNLYYMFIRKVKVLVVAVACLMCLYSCENSQQYNKHQLDISWPEGLSELPFKIEVTDVSAEIVNEKYTDFTGFKIVADYTLNRLDKGQDTALIVVLKGLSASVDSVYDFRLGSWVQQELGVRLSEQIASVETEIQMGELGHPALINAWEYYINLFMEEIKASDRMKVYYQGKKDYVRALSKSLYTFPGRFTKGYAWEDEFKVIVSDEYGVMDEETVKLDWELLRINDKDLVFFGKGRAYSNKNPEDLVGKMDYKRQFGINLVLNRDGNYLKRGTVDLREESAKVRKDEASGDLIRVPVSVRNIKIKLNPIKND